jgi:ABC-type glycerol-3-phosphate transport system substrate-binding protein
MKDAGLVGADGKPQIPTNREELIAAAAKLAPVTGGLGFSFGAANYVWAFHNLLWQNETNVYTADMKKSPLNEPPAIEVGEFWGSVRERLKTPEAGVNSRDAFVAGKLGLWVAGTWNITGLADAKVDFAVGPMPKLFKKAVAWTIPHQYTFPKPKTKDEAKRAAGWTHIRWITDNVAVWTSQAGQVSAFKKAHTDPKVTGNPSLKVFLDQAPTWQVGQPTVKWVKAETLTRPVVEAIYTGQKQAKPALEDLAKQINAIPD